MDFETFKRYQRDGLVDEKDIQWLVQEHERVLALKEERERLVRKNVENPKELTLAELKELWNGLCASLQTGSVAEINFEDAYNVFRFLERYEKDQRELEFLKSDKIVRVPTDTYNYDSQLYLDLKVRYEKLLAFLNVKSVDDLIGTSIDTHQAVEEYKAQHLHNFQFHDLKVRDGGLDMRLSGEPAKLFMQMLIEFFVQNGGKNFLTLTVHLNEHKYGINIENANGTLTMAEKLQNMQQEMTSLKEQLAQLQK